MVSHVSVGVHVAEQLCPYPHPTLTAQELLRKVGNMPYLAPSAECRLTHKAEGGGEEEEEEEEVRGVFLRLLLLRRRRLLLLLLVLLLLLLLFLLLVLLLRPPPPLLLLPCLPCFPPLLLLPAFPPFLLLFRMPLPLCRNQAQQGQEIWTRTTSTIACSLVLLV